MRKIFVDTIDKVKVDFHIIVTPHEKKGKKSTHPDMENMPARMITEYVITGAVIINGANQGIIHEITCYNESSVLENLPRFETTLWEKAATIVRSANIETFDSKLKKLGYE
jgi:hypothetical protein